MKKFSFALEPVLAYRKIIEEREQQKLQMIESAIEESKLLQESLRHKIHRYGQMLSGKAHQAIDVQLMKNLASYMEKLQADLSEEFRHMSKLQEDKKSQSNNLIKAKQQREVVEELKDKDFAIHEKELLAMEQKVLDEGAAARFMRANEQLLPAPESDSSKA